MDEAASRLRLEMNSVPQEIDEIQRKIKQLEIEREAIKREGQSQRLKSLSREIEDLSEENTRLRAQWQSEKDLIDRIQKNIHAIDALKFEADQAEREGDFGRVAEIRYGKVRELEEENDKLREELVGMQGESTMIREEVGYEDIAEVVSKWTGIPVTRMLQTEREKLLHLEEELHQRVVGQEEAVQAVADAVRRSRAGLQDARKPIGSFIFLGTTGVGKTELAKALAEYLFNDENMLTRIDMSEYQERHSVSRLIGAPPGYVGYDEGGQLTEAVRRKPYSVILLDEIEKAHPDVFNILLQVLDDGRLTDNKGRVANFKNTIIIMTSNVGSHLIQEEMSKLTDQNRESVVESTKKQIFALLKQSIRPEFLNRIDEIIMFLPLTGKEVRRIVQLQLDQVQAMLNKRGMDVKIPPEVVDLLARDGFDPQFGARPVKRVIQKSFLNRLSKDLISGNISENDAIEAFLEGDEIQFRKTGKKQSDEIEQSV
jgi:ATP-dependent Clp protease ATP-binding subunit ClpB